uniref:Protein EMSY n=1 Tax=Anthurium amnicola TaxID=1678845 RepID=A0A1D1XPP2_9ARAE
MRIISEMETHQLHLTDMEFEIHRVETEAYGAVLSAFIAQSDVLSWGKEALISELRKELRVSDVEHREILAKVNADRSVKALRKLHKDASPQQELLSVPRKRLKIAHAPLSSPPRHLLHVQTSAAVPLPMAHFRDNQWDSSRTIASQANVGQGICSVPHSKQTSSQGKGRGSIPVQSSRKGSGPSGYLRGNVLKSGPNMIEIRATEKLIHEVKRICGGENPDPRQVERAKLILREHERALLEAIAKLPNDDGESAMSI